MLLRSSDRGAPEAVGDSMNAITRRPMNPIAELLSWLEAEPSSMRRGLGLTPDIRVEDYVEDHTYVLRAEMPGIDPDKDVEVNVLDDVLTIRGERKEAQHERNRHEFHYGSFERRMRLPRGTNADDIKADYHDGVLELRIPFQGEEPKAVRVPVARTDG
jgi:HSP20 family protein